MRTCGRKSKHKPLNLLRDCLLNQRLGSGGRGRAGSNTSAQQGGSWSGRKLQEMAGNGESLRNVSSREG